MDARNNSIMRVVGIARGFLIVKTQHPFEGRFAPRPRLVVEMRSGLITKRAIELSSRPPDAEVFQRYGELLASRMDAVPVINQQLRPPRDCARLASARASHNSLSGKMFRDKYLDGCCAIAQP